MENIQNIENYIRDMYILWSNEFPLACVDTGNPQIQYDEISISFDISANFIPTEEQSIKALGNDIFHKIQEEEVKNFLLKLGNPTEIDMLEGSLSLLEKSVKNGYDHFFSEIGKPDTIIWSRKLAAEFMQKARQGIPPKFYDNQLKQVLVNDPTFSEIILLRKNRYYKIYPGKTEERFSLNVKPDPAGNISTKFLGRILHKVLYDKNKEFVKITISN